MRPLVVLAIVPVATAAAAILSPAPATAQEIQLTGPIGCAPVGYCSPSRRTRLEVTLGLGAMGEIETGTPKGARAEPAATLGFGAEARFLPERSIHGAAIGATLGLGPTLRLDRGRTLEQLVSDAAYVFHLDLHHADEGKTERHVLGFAELGISGRWAWFDAASTAFALGPRVSLGVDVHWGICGRTILGIGFDVRSLHATGLPPLHTALISGQIRVGWDLPSRHDYCED